MRIADRSVSQETDTFSQSPPTSSPSSGKADAFGDLFFILRGSAPNPGASKGVHRIRRCRGDVETDSLIKARFAAPGGRVDAGGFETILARFLQRMGRHRAGRCGLCCASRGGNGGRGITTIPRAACSTRCESGSGGTHGWRLA